MKFSIIVPVYNVENYLVDCIESLVNQKFDSYEILIINDGSTDNSGEICDEYATKYDNIRVFHKKNGGLSDARNYGIKNAKGDYLIFVDSDDWIALDSLKKISEAIGDKNPQVVETCLVEAYADKYIYRDLHFCKYLSKDFTRTRAIKWMMQKSKNTWPAPKRIVSSEFVKEKGILFCPGKLHEDLDWTSNLCYHAERYVGCSFSWYFHRMDRSGSITNSIKAQNIIDVIEMASSHYKRYMEQKNSINRIVVNRIMISVYVMLKRVNSLAEEDKEKVVASIENNKDFFKIAPKIKYKIFVFISKVVGVKMAINMLCKMN